MSLEYKVPVRLGRLNLRSTDDKARWDVVEEYLNHAFDVLNGLYVEDKEAAVAEGAAAEEAGVAGAYDLIFPNPPRVVKWAHASCAINATTTVVSNVSGKYLGVVYFYMNNTDEDDGKTVHMLHETDATTYFKSWLPKDGSTVAINLIGSCIVGADTDKKVQVVVSNDGSDPVEATIGYVELDTDFVDFSQERDRREQGNTEEPY